MLTQLVQRAGAVVGVAGGRSLDVAVQDADLEARPGDPGEAPRQVLGLPAVGVADPLHGRGRDSVDLDRDGPDRSGTEDLHQFGPVVAEGGPPRLDRVVVAVHDEARDARGRESGETVAEPELRPKPSLRPVVDVAGDDEEGGPPLEAQIHERVERGEGGFA